MKGIPRTNMTTQQDEWYDPLEYLPSLFWIREDKPLPFLDFPAVVLWKFFKQYVRLITKIDISPSFPSCSDAGHRDCPDSFYLPPLAPTGIVRHLEIFTRSRLLRFDEFGK